MRVIFSPKPKNSKFSVYQYTDDNSHWVEIDGEIEYEGFPVMRVNGKAKLKAKVGDKIFIHINNIYDMFERALESKGVLAVFFAGDDFSLSVLEVSIIESSILI